MMKSQSLSHRLQAVANFVEQYANQPIRLADIGTDHAYLPVNLILNQKISYAIAGDVAKGPLQSAEQEVLSHQLQDMISVRLGDGLSVVDPKDYINTVSICGMGGKLMTDILYQGHQYLTPNHTLILQANTGAHIVRNWLSHHAYAIVDETVIDEDGHLYEIIVAQSQIGSGYSPKEIYLGPCLIQDRCPAWHKKIQSDYHHLTHVVKAMSQAKNKDAEKIQFYQQALSYIKEYL